MTTEPEERAQAVARLLRERGHASQADQIAAAANAHRGGGFLELLREACQTVLTGIEAIDPASYAAIEELRMDVDRRLDTGRTSG